jgi:uncharacterized protein YjbJ (UPF0337 family)
MATAKNHNGRAASLEGVVEDVKGRVKEVIGRVTGRRNAEPAATKRQGEQRRHQVRQR